MRRSAARLVLGFVCVLVGLIGAPAGEPDERPLKPCVVITGADSHVTERRCQRITSNDDWTRVWQEHKGQKPTGQYDLHYDPLTLPLIDFDRYMVITIFQGNGWNNAGLKVVSISDEDSRIVVRFSNKGYQTSGPDGGGRKVTAYGFLVVPRSTKSVVIKEDVHEHIGEPPVWKERITFPKL